MCHSIAIKNECVPIKLVVNLIILFDKHYAKQIIYKKKIQKHKKNCKRKIAPHVFN